MKPVMVVWNKSNERMFERQIPLLFGGLRNRRLGSRNQIDILFLEGLEDLGEGYREGLADLGYTLHDVSTVYREFERKYVPLMRFGGYELKCFLRWPVIREYFGAIPIVHFDADIVFNATPEELVAAFCGLTFILQGCPAFSVISDPKWFDAYRRELDIFVADMEAYSAYAWSKRCAFASCVKERNAAIWDRRILGSDQDLLQFATLDARIPHAPASALKIRNPFALFQNPLCLGRDLDMPHPVCYKRSAGIDYFDGLKVAFWHMQNDFCDYLGHADFRNTLHIPGRVLLRREERPLDYVFFRALRKAFGGYSRLRLCQRYFGGSEELGFLFNPERYWQEGVFAPNRCC
jgi:hypothetical protein